MPTGQCAARISSTFSGHRGPWNLDMVRHSHERPASVPASFQRDGAPIVLGHHPIAAPDPAPLNQEQLRERERGTLYQRLQDALTRAEFDATVEELCAPYYARRRGRPSLPPGVYYRMMLVAHLEKVSSQRELARRSGKDPVLRWFLSIDNAICGPNHSTLTVIRRRLPREVHDQVYRRLTQILNQSGVLPELLDEQALDSLRGLRAERPSPPPLSLHPECPAPARQEPAPAA